MVHAVFHRHILDAWLASYSSLAWLFIRLSLSSVPLVTISVGYGTYHPLVTPLLAVGFWKMSVAIAPPIIYVHTKAVETAQKVKTAIHYLSNAVYNAVLTLVEMVIVAALANAAAHVVIVGLMAYTHVGGDGPATLYGHELADFTVHVCQWLVCGSVGLVGIAIVASRPVTSALFIISCPFWLFVLPKVLLPVVAFVAWSQCAKEAHIICDIAERIANAVCAAFNTVCAVVDALCQLVQEEVTAFLLNLLEWTVLGMAVLVFVVQMVTFVAHP